MSSSTLDANLTSAIGGDEDIGLDVEKRCRSFVDAGGVTWSVRRRVFVFVYVYCGLNVLLSIVFLLFGFPRAQEQRKGGPSTVDR